MKIVTLKPFFSFLCFFFSFFSFDQQEVNQMDGGIYRQSHFPFLESLTHNLETSISILSLKAVAGASIMREEGGNGGGKNWKLKQFVIHKRIKENKKRGWIDLFSQ